MREPTLLIFERAGVALLSLQTEDGLAAIRGHGGDQGLPAREPIVPGRRQPAFTGPRS